MQTDRLNRLSDLLFELTQQANDDDKPEVFGSSVRIETGLSSTPQ